MPETTPIVDTTDLPDDVPSRAEYNIDRDELRAVADRVRVRLPEPHLSFAAALVSRIRRDAIAYVEATADDLVAEYETPAAYRDLKRHLASADGPTVELTTSQLTTLWDALVAWRCTDGLDTTDRRYRYVEATASRADKALFVEYLRD